jgi:hypothetical protein
MSDTRHISNCCLFLTSVQYYSLLKCPTLFFFFVLELFGKWIFISCEINAAAPVHEFSHSVPLCLCRM